MGGKGFGSGGVGALWGGGGSNRSWPRGRGPWLQERVGGGVGTMAVPKERGGLGLGWLLQRGASPGKGSGKGWLGRRGARASVAGG